MAKRWWTTSYGVLDRRPVSPLMTSGSFGQGLALLFVDRRQRCSVVGAGANGQGPACAPSAGQAQGFRIANGARLQRSQGHRAGRSQSARLQPPSGVSRSLRMFAALGLQGSSSWAGCMAGPGPALGGPGCPLHPAGQWPDDLASGPLPYWQVCAQSAASSALADRAGGHGPEH